jgi:hypothetical protein
VGSGQWAVGEKYLYLSSLKLLLMKTIASLISFLILLLVFSCNTSNVESSIDFYQLKVYSLDTLSNDDVLDNYLSEAYLPALHRAGIEKVGVFKTIEGRNNGQKLTVVFIPFQSLSQFENLPAVLEQDEEYLISGRDYIEAAHDMPPYMRIESTLLNAFSATPVFHVPELDTRKADRVYELRSYHSATEKLHKRKVEMFNSGESDLFIELGFQPVFFGEVISGAHMPNLIYLTCHANEESQPENWKSFGKHPVWNEMKMEEKYKNTVSHIDKWMLYPAEYSDI